MAHTGNRHIHWRGHAARLLALAAAAFVTDAAAVDGGRPSQLPGVSLRPQIGFGWSQDTSTGQSSPHLEAGLLLAVAATAELTVSIDVLDASYRREYLSTDLDLTGRGFARATVRENKAAATVHVLYELSRLLVGTLGPVAVRAGGGGALRWFMSEELPMLVAGPSAAIEARFDLAPELQLLARTALAYNVLGAPTPPFLIRSATTFVTTAEVCVRMAVDRNALVGFGYRGEALTLVQSHRLFHSLLLSVELSLG